jgi:hypothetical protein
VFIAFSCLVSFVRLLLNIYIPFLLFQPVDPCVLVIFLLPVFPSYKQDHFLEFISFSSHFSSVCPPCIHVHMCIHADTHMYIYIYTHAYVHTCTCICMYTYIYILVRTCICAIIYMSICVDIRMYVCMRFFPFSPVASVVHVCMCNIPFQYTPGAFSHTYAFHTKRMSMGPDCTWINGVDYAICCQDCGGVIQVTGYCSYPCY